MWHSIKIPTAQDRRMHLMRCQVLQSWAILLCYQELKMWFSMPFRESQTTQLIEQRICAGAMVAFGPLGHSVQVVQRL